MGHYFKFSLLTSTFLVPVYTDQPVSSASPPTRDKINGDEKARSRRRDTWAEPSTNQGTDEGIFLRIRMFISENSSWLPDASLVAITTSKLVVVIYLYI